MRKINSNGFSRVKKMTKKFKILNLKRLKNTVLKLDSCEIVKLKLRKTLAGDRIKKWGIGCFWLEFSELSV